jgi:type II secretory pathway component PulC
VIVEEPRTELSVSLVGIIISSDEHIAIVSPNDGTGILRLYRGDEVQGWTLVSIEPDRVIFRRGDEEERVELNYERAPVRSERPRRPRQRENPNNREITQ